MKKANIYDTPLRERTIPSRFERPNGKTVDGYKTLTDLHTIDGWRDIVIPQYDPGTHILGNLLKDGDEITYYVVNIPVLTIEEATEKSLKTIKQAYEEHKLNGWDAYQDFRAKVVLDIDLEVITLPEAFQIENALNIAYNRIASTGDWKTAQYELSLITVPEFIQPYYDEAMIIISEYINLKY